MKFLLHFLFVHVLCLGLLAQTGAPNKSAPAPVPPPAAVPAPPVGLIVSDPIYPLPLEERDPARRLQIQWDEIELDTQRKLVEIEKNHERQAQIEEQLKVIAIKFAQKKQVNLDLYQWDPKELKWDPKDPTRK